MNCILKEWNRLMPMTLGEKLLNLSIEYSDTLQARALTDEIDESLIGRDPAVIAAEYEEALRELIKPAPSEASA